MLVSEPFSGSTAAGPDFIENESNLAMVAKFAQFDDVVGVCRMNATFALDRLENDGGCFAVDGSGKAFHVAEVDLRKAGGHRLETSFHGRISRGGDHRK